MHAFIRLLLGLVLHSVAASSRLGIQCREVQRGNNQGGTVQSKG